MNALNISPTDSTPKIVFDPAANKFEVSGESRPDDSRKFYDPVVKWLEQYETTLNSSSNIVFDFRIDYFNSSSKIYIMAILKQLFNYHMKGIQVKAKWHYDEMDDDMKETGEALSKIVDIPFEFISY